MCVEEHNTHEIHMTFLLFCMAFALPLFQHSEYLARVSTHSTTEIVVLISPGWNEQTLEPLLKELWTSGFSVWYVEFPLHAQHPEDMYHSIQHVISQHKKPIVVAQGFTGSLFVDHAEEFSSQISGLAMLGSPLSFYCSPAFVHALQNNTWSEFTNPPIHKAEISFHHYLLQKCDTPLSVGTTIPIDNLWIATTNTHPFAPPESIRPVLQHHHQFVRSGPLALHGAEPYFLDLYAHPPTLHELTYWLRHLTQKEQSQ